MNAEKLDGLLVDYSLGAVPEDVAMLIEACAKNDPAIRKSIAAYRGVAELAKRAGDAPSPSLPAFPRQQMERARYSQQARRAIRWVAAAAACVVIGFLGGTRWSGPVSEVATPVVQVNAPAGPAADVQVAAATDFWSVARLRAYAKRQALAANVHSVSADAWNVKSWADIQRIGG